MQIPTPTTGAISNALSYISQQTIDDYNDCGLHAAILLATHLRHNDYYHACDGAANQRDAILQSFHPFTDASLREYTAAHETLCADFAAIPHAATASYRLFLSSFSDRLREFECTYSQPVAYVFAVASINLSKIDPDHMLHAIATARPPRFAT